MIQLPLISIVTPSFNQAEYLEECIESVLAQGYPKLEYIIMDGGSSDGSVEIIKKYEKYLTYWQSCPDGGQYCAIEAGFRRATGEIMAWLNSDDKYHPLAFAKIASIFTAHQDVQWLTGHKTQWDHNGNLLWQDGDAPIFSRKKYLNGHFNYPYIQQESTFWRRGLWASAGGKLDTSLELAGDMELWSRFFRHAPLYVVDTMLGGFRAHDNQRSKDYVDIYLLEAAGITDREQHCYAVDDELPSPPSPLTLSREDLECVICGGQIQPTYPNHTRCWCEYAEDLIYITDLLVQQNRIETVLFWQNEMSLFALTKPNILLRLGREINLLLDSYNSCQILLDDALKQEQLGCCEYALHGFRQVFDLTPTSSSAASGLLRCLWSLDKRDESLGLLTDILRRHPHDSDVIRATLAILTGVGATEQALTLCNEYLKFNPHDEVASMFMESLNK